MKWNPFSKEDIMSIIKKCNNSLTPELDKLCIDLGHWPLHFKVLTTIVISKPNKKFYNSFKAYQPIVLLNTVSKLFEKVIGERL